MQGFCQKYKKIDFYDKFKLWWQNDDVLAKKSHYEDTRTEVFSQKVEKHWSTAMVLNVGRTAAHQI